MTPTVAVSIAVDTAYVASLSNGGFITRGVYMCDNMLAAGSSGEGTLSLHTKCSAGSLIGFQSVPIDGEGSSGDQVVITSFVTVSGNVFTGAGHPIQQPPFPNQPAGSYWVGQALAAGTETFTIQVKVTTGILQPVVYYVSWDASITAS